MAIGSRGEFVHGGRAEGRPYLSNLPRLSRVLAAHLENTREQTAEDFHNPEDAEEDFQMTHSIASPVRMAEGSNIHTEVDEDQAERMLQKYRQMRDAGYDQPFSREDIQDAYNSRFDY